MPKPKPKAQTPRGTNGTPSARKAEAATRQRDEFLRLIGQGISTSTAAKGAGSSRTTVYRWRQDDAKFAAAWDDAKETGLDRLEDKALQLAHAGSEKLIIFLLKAGRPEKYRENIKHDHDHSGSIEVNNDEVRAAIQSKLARITAAAGSGAVARKPNRT